MKVILATLFLVLGSIGLNAQNSASGTTTPAGSERVVRVEGDIDAPVSSVWRAFTTSQGAEQFFAQKANIGLAIGGPYEIQFDPNDERSGTKGLKILSYAPEEMISFQWNAPPEMPEVRSGGTWVVVEMHPMDAYRTHVTISHLGMGCGVCAFSARLERVDEPAREAVHRWPNQLERAEDDVPGAEGPQAVKRG
jgi:uncharacterized protein YndB with AHSA1/START domain